MPDPVSREWFVLNDSRCLSRKNIQRIKGRVFCDGVNEILRKSEHNAQYSLFIHCDKLALDSRYQFLVEYCENYRKTFSEEK